MNDDLISRQAAINTVLNIRKKCDTNDIDEYQDILVECFEELPTAEKKGKWVEEVGMLMCSECGDAWGTEQFDEVKSFNYCPNCGARMKESE